MTRVRKTHPLLGRGTGWGEKEFKIGDLFKQMWEEGRALTSQLRGPERCCGPGAGARATRAGPLPESLPPVSQATQPSLGVGVWPWGRGAVGVGVWSWGELGSGAGRGGSVGPTCISFPLAVPLQPDTCPLRYGGLGKAQGLGFLIWEWGRGGSSPGFSACHR